MISKLRMLTEKNYADGVNDATAEVLGILHTIASYPTDREVTNALTAFIIGTETLFQTGSADKATEAFNQVRNLR